MKTIIAGVRRLLVGAEGASIVEYSLALLLMAVVTLAAIGALGTVLSNFFTSAASSV
jgi:Flp pilus assembly pilin Flp